MERHSYSVFSYLEWKKGIEYTEKDYNTLNRGLLNSINRGMKEQIRSKLDNMYDEMNSSGRIPTKWGREYRLFWLVRHFVRDVEYQYYDAWLEGLSLDIYISRHKM